MRSVPLSDDELLRAAIGARSLALMHERKARDSRNPAPHTEQARRYRALAERFEEARKPAHGG